MKNTFKYIWLFALIMLIAGLSTTSFAQRRGGGGSFGGGRSSSYAPRNYTPPAQTYRAPSSPSQMRPGGTMGSGINSGSGSTSSSSQMRSGGTMGSGINSGSGSTSSKMKSGGTMNTTPPPVTVPSGASTNSRSNTKNSTSTSTSTSYRYKTYSGPRETTYNGRQVYININGGYSYYPGGPVIAYMPGYTPVPYTPVGGGFGFGAILWTLVAVIVVVCLIVLIAKNT